MEAPRGTNTTSFSPPVPRPCRSIDNYTRLGKIDEGTYGIVWKAKENATDKIFALKQVKFPSEITREGFPIAALREINVLRTLNHANILNVKEMVVGETSRSVFMVMDLMEMDLKDACDNLTEPLTQGELKHVMLQLLSAIECMHSHYYFHRDLKTSNILVHKSGKICVCDFGLTRTFDEPLRNDYTPLVITLFYRPPELLMGTSTYGPEVDIWSIGCIFAELITREQLFVGNGEIDQVRGLDIDFSFSSSSSSSSFSSSSLSPCWSLTSTDSLSQLAKIFQTLRAPSEDNWEGFSKLKHAHALRWNGPKVSKLREKFPANNFENKTFLNQNGFILLEKMLMLDPKRRITAKSALEGVYFSEAPLPSQVRWNWNNN